MPGQGLSRVGGKRTMPHFGLIDEENMTEEEVLLMRARLHLRSGRRRLNEGKFPDGVVTLYDAVYSAMQWAALTAEWWRKCRDGDSNELLCDETRLHDLLVQNHILPESLAFQDLLRLKDLAVRDDLPVLDRRDLLNRVEAIMTALGVLPFDENALPPEAPGTY